MMLPARMNIGSATSMKRLMPEIIICGSVTPQDPAIKKFRITALMIETSMGTPMSRSPTSSAMESPASAMISPLQQEVRPSTYL
jgi:hypothetical protein